MREARHRSRTYYGVAMTRADSKHGKLYLGMANMIEVRLGDVEIPEEKQ